MASVSVVIPCYRYGTYLEQCTRSVLDDQPGVDVRVLIIDDASDDGSADAARAIAARDSRVEVIVHAANRGHLATYNEGLLEWADGDYCVLLSADDLLTPGALTRATALLDAHPEVSFAYGHPIHFNPDRPLPPARTEGGWWSIWPGERWLRRRFRAATGCITSPEVVVRTSVHKQVGGYRPDLPATGDMEMWMRLAVHGQVGYLGGVDQAYYRLHASSMSKTTYAASLTDLIHRKLAYDHIVDSYGDRLGRGMAWADVVNKALAKEALWEAGRAYDRRRTDTVDVQQLEDFARSCWPETDQLLGLRTLRVRQRLGPTVMPYLDPLVVTAAVRRARNWWWWRTWARHGV
jgi:glycosyltransferase involved in cell wall biosynthesis